MIYSICLELMFSEVPFYERFRKAKEAGFDAVAFWGWQDKELSKIKDECMKYDLSVTNFNGDEGEYSLLCPEDNEKYYENFLRTLETAKYLDCKAFMVHSDALNNWVAKPMSSRLTRKEKEDNIVMMLNKMAEECDREGIMLTYEGLNNIVDHLGYFSDSTDESVALLKQVKAGKVKYLYDVYHMQIMEGNIIGTIQKYKDYIGMIQFADVPGRNEPGTGEINLTNILRAVKEIGYEGVFEFELSPKKSTQEALAAILKCIKEAENAGGY